MRVLVVEDTVGNSVDVVLDLVEAGYEVLRCQPLGGEVVPCFGLSGDGTCPLHEPADAVVQVHDRADPLTLRELGVLCGGRAKLPIINVGHSRSTIATRWTTPEQLLDDLASIADPRPPRFR